MYTIKKLVSKVNKFNAVTETVDVDYVDVMVDKLSKHFNSKSGWYCSIKSTHPTQYGKSVYLAVGVKTPVRFGKQKFLFGGTIRVSDHSVGGKRLYEDGHIQVVVSDNIVKNKKALRGAVADVERGYSEWEVKVRKLAKDG